MAAEPEKSLRVSDAKGYLARVKEIFERDKDEVRYGKFLEIMKDFKEHRWVSGASEMR